MDTLNHFDPREERHAKEDIPRRADTYKRPWHLQGWVWLIVACISLSVLIIAIAGLTDQIAHVNGSIRQQTEELRHQNWNLATLGQGVNRIETAIVNGFDRVVTAINNFNR